MPRSASNCSRICCPKAPSAFPRRNPASIRIPPACPTARIEIAGHTDADGEDGFNQALSEKRAQSVMDYLVKAGLPSDRFTAGGYGSSQPIASNGTDEGKAQNRRIEFVVR